MRKFVFGLLLFFYTYNVSFAFCPSVSFIEIFALIGVALAFLYFIVLRKISGVILKQIFLFCVLFSWSLIPVFVNSSNFDFIQYELILHIIIPFFAAFFINIVGYKFISSPFDILNYFFVASCIQSVVSILSYFFTPVKNFLLTIQVVEERVLPLIESGLRTYGIGSGFDYGSFIISYSLLITVLFYIITGKKFYIVFYFIQAIAGFLMARSIIIGIFCSMMFLIISSSKAKIKVDFISIVFVSVLILCLVMIFFFPEILSKYSETLDWISEIFNMKDSATVNILLGDMYWFPKTLRSLFCGDGLFLDENHVAYMHTDAMYMRYLIYGGFPVLVFFFIYLISNFVALKSDVFIPVCLGANEKKLYRQFLDMVFFMSCIIYIKLISHCFYLVFMLFWFSILQKNNRHSCFKTNQFCRRAYE